MDAQVTTTTDEVVDLEVKGEIGGGGVALSLKGVSKTFAKGALPVLNDLNMRVATGSLYGVLGASGCGKTSLFKVVLGLLKMDRGEIRLFGHPPTDENIGVPGHNVGYMPQETGLHDELSIEETWLYFGLVSGMTLSHIRLRSEYMASFLNLHPVKRMVGKLSGGQKRRVSFASALLHQPPLLILDEPTVGVDPLLRKKIWNHLTYLSESSGTTIIISTHYMEEAIRLHTIGMMCEGELLAEASPQALLSVHQAKTLDDVFYALCLTHSQEKEPKNERQEEEEEKVPEELEEEMEEDRKVVVMVRKKNLRTKKVLASVAKNALRFYRHPGVLLMSFLLPTLQVAVALLAFGGSFNHLPLAIVNEDTKEFGAIFIDAIDSQIIQKDMFTTYEEGRRAVVEGAEFGLMRIGPNFTDSLMARFSHGLFVQEEDIAQSTINISLDLTNIQVAHVLTRTLLLTFQDFSASSLQRLGFNPQALTLPLNMTEPVYGEVDAPFSDFVVPALMVSISYFLAMGLTSLGFVMERVGGQAERGAAAGLGPLENVFGHVLTHALVLMVQEGLMFAVVFGVFRVPCLGSYLLAFLLILGQGVCGMLFGIVVGAICEQENTAIMTVVGIFFPSIILNGSLWPLEALPLPLRYLSLAIPQTLPTQAFRALVTKGWDLSYPPLQLAFSVTLLWILTHFFTSVLIFRWKR